MNSLNPIVTRPGNLTEQVLERIQESIVNGTLGPGTRISEVSIATLLNVSKTPVREALLRLRHIGLVVETGTGRLRVLDPSSKAIRDAYEFRATIERAAALEAATRIGAKAAEQLLDYAQDTVIMAKAQTDKGYSNTDRQFHLAVAAATTNDVLHAAVGNAFVLTSAMGAREVAMAEEFVACAREHVAIAEAVRDGKSAEAGDAMAAHILHVMAQVLATQPVTSGAPATSAPEAVSVSVTR